MPDLDLEAIRERAERASYIGGAAQDLGEDTLAILHELERLRERQESFDLANEGIRWKRRAIAAEAEIDRLRISLDSMDHFASVAAKTERRNNELRADRDHVQAQVERIEGLRELYQAIAGSQRRVYLETIIADLNRELAGSTETRH